MHDLSLGAPVEDERDPAAPHKGRCFDGVYGCHLCWNGANDGKGTLAHCEWCKAEDVHTRVVRAIDEPVMYAICATCESRQRQRINELERELDSYYDDCPDHDEWGSP